MPTSGFHWDKITRAELIKDNKGDQWLALLGRSQHGKLKILAQVPFQDMRSLVDYWPEWAGPAD